MGLNPGDNIFEKILGESFNGGSPYADMFRCGYNGVPFELCAEKCARNSIALRRKDVAAYNDGVFKSGISEVYVGGVKVKVSDIVKPAIPFESMRLSDFPAMPVGWKGTEKRFFPCTEDNKPMQKWGYTRNADGSLFVPELYLRCDAKALSPCGWVGQNMLYQTFIVVDIDGRGHGQDDEDTIAFGNLFKDETFSTEDPKKPGSFHLYFETDRLIPVRHFPWAKIDLMGNAVNAAVYFKNKIGNGTPLLRLDEGIWRILMDYQKGRKERLCH